MLQISLADRCREAVVVTTPKGEVIKIYVMTVDRRVKSAMLGIEAPKDIRIGREKGEPKEGVAIDGH